MRRVAAVVIRLLAIIGKELTEAIRRPGALASLVLGPFLIMAIFGLGYDGIRRPLDVIVVTPAGSGLPQDIEAYQSLAGGGIRVVGVTSSIADAQASLQVGAVDLVAVAPTDPESEMRAGRQAVIEVRIDTVDPFRASYAGILSAAMADAVNQRIVERAVQTAQAKDPSGAAADVAPALVAAPTRARLVDIAPTEPNVIAFYGSAVLALILQHLCITLVAISLVRERTSGAIELYRVAPISAGELMTGKVLAFGVLGTIVAATTLAIFTTAFSVPVLAPLGVVAIVVGALLLASLGVGLLVALVSDSERQVVQLSLLLLLASVFFSGFVLQLDEFSAPVRALAYLLPVTPAIQLLQDLLLRGQMTDVLALADLALIAAVSLGASLFLLRRGLRRAG